MESERKRVRLTWGEVSYLEWAPLRAVPAPVHASGVTPAQANAEEANDAGANAAEASGGGRTLLLLHGGGLDSAELSWGGLGAAVAAAGFRVIAPDHPGYGESPHAPWAATQERLVAYAGEFADALGLEHYVVGGLSLGGGIAIGHALERPHSVTGAVLLGSYGLMDRQFTGWYAGPAHFATWVLLRTGILGALMRSSGAHRDRMERGLRAIIRSPEQRTPELIDAIMEAAAGGGGLAAFEAWQRDQFLWNRLRTNYLERLGSFPCRALVIHGDHDAGVPLAFAEAAARRMPDAELLVVPGAGHWVQRDRPDLVIPAMIDFLGARRGN